MCMSVFVRVFGICFRKAVSCHVMSYHAKGLKKEIKENVAKTGKREDPSVNSLIIKRRQAKNR